MAHDDRAPAAPPRTTRIQKYDPTRDAVRIGVNPGTARDLYHQTLTAPWWKLALGVLTVYISTNALFACGYLALGDGIESARRGSFVDAFFFSVQTMATIGYGKMTPRSIGANLLVTVEALMGLLGVAIGTGLVFTKFARPTARVMFSRVAVVAVRDGVPSLMFRMANERSNQIVEASLRVVFASDEKTLEGESVRRFFDLKLARSSNAMFGLSWTAIHPIDASSPLHGATAASLAARNVGLVVSLIGMDEHLSQTIHARHTYDAANILWDHRFVDILGRTPDGRRSVDYSRFHDTVPVGQ